MSYSTIYQSSLDGKIKEDNQYMTSACFSGFYNSVMSLKKVEVIVLKDYKGLPGARMTMSEEEVFKFYENLRDCEFDFTLTVAKRHIAAGSIGKVDCYVFHIDVHKNSRLVNLILLNAIRYLYEAKMPLIATAFNKLMDHKHPLSAFNKFLLAHSLSDGHHSGHSLIPSNGTVFKHYTPEMFVTRILKAPDSVDKMPWQKLGQYVGYTANLLLERISDPGATLFAELKKHYETNQLDKLFKTYESQVMVR